MTSRSMDEVAGFRDTRTHVAAEKAEQPQDDQNDNDGPQHEISPSINSPIGKLILLVTHNRLKKVGISLAHFPALPLDLSPGLFT